MIPHINVLESNIPAPFKHNELMTERAAVK